MVASQHDRTYFAITYHFIEFQGDVHTPDGILIENTGLGTYYQLVLFCIANPNPVVHVLPSAFLRNTFHGSSVGLDQIFMFPAETNPTERSVTIIEQFRSHDVFHVRWPDEAVFFIHTVAGDFLHSGIVDGFHERIAVIEEISTLCHQCLDGFKVSFQTFVHFRFESRSVFLQKTGTFLEADARRTIATFIYCMTRCLVTEEFDVYAMVQCIFQQVHHIAMIGDGARTLFFHGFVGQLVSFLQIGSDVLHPTLVMTCSDTRIIHFGNDGRCSGYFGCFRLGTAHASQARGHEQMTIQIAILRNTELHSPGI